jgi:high frequency lysogenization protein
MQKNFYDLTLALAGIFQAISLVDQTARTGQVDQDSLQTSLRSILELNPENTLAIYGGDVGNLRIGLELLKQVIVQNSSKYQDLIRYALGVLHLQKKLAGRKDMLNLIASRIEQATQQTQHFSITHDNVIANLGGIYSDTISTFRFRIQVKGDYNYLQQQRLANQIRALLLAAVRSAMLWRQLGGNRWQLIFQRKKIVACVDEMLKNINSLTPS